MNYDGNCNGIWGLDEQTGIPWETKLCGSSKARGIVMFGDSVGAHFHFPLVWFNPKLITKVSKIYSSVCIFILFKKIISEKEKNLPGYFFEKFNWCFTR